MKKAAIIIGIISALVIGAFLGKNLVARAALSRGVTAITGLKFTAESVNVGVFKSSIDMKGLKLLNPSGFTDPVMVDIPRIYVDYNLGDCIRKKVHLEELILHLEEVVVVKNKEGELNLDCLKVVKDEKEKETTDEGEEEKEGKAPDIQIDVLALRIGKVVYKDYSRSSSPKSREFKVNIDERYENITDLQELGRLVAVRALTKTTIAQLADFDLGSLHKGLGDITSAATTGIEKGAEEVLGVGKEAAREATKTIEKLFGK